MRAQITRRRRDQMLPADLRYTDWKLEDVAKALNTVPLPQEVYEILSDLHSAVMGLMREVRGR
jgi:hypothetical protein